MRIVYIYGLWDPRNGRLRYIGKTIGLPRDRLAGHIREAKKEGPTNHLRCWITGILQDGDKPMIEILEDTDEEHWKEVERDWIRQCREMGVDLVNIADGGLGGGTRGRVASEETRQKMRDKWADPEWRIKNVESRRRSPKPQGPNAWTEEQREAFREKRKTWKPRLGMKNSQEQNAKISAANAIIFKGRPLPEGATEKGHEVRWSDPTAGERQAQAMEQYRDPVTGRFLPKEAVE